MANITDVLTNGQPLKQNQKDNTTTNDTKKALATKHIRVGDDYFKMIETPDKDGKTYQILVPRGRQTVKDDVGSFYNEILKYEGFCNVPSHINYQKEIARHYNQYKEVNHKPEQGSFESIKNLLNHLFKSHYDFILDYLQILYLKPTQRLPIILLESKERNTGKSTFGNLIQYIFQENAIKVGNSEMSSDFNAIWGTRLLVVVDEASLNNDLLMEMIKRYSTENGKVTINEKGKKQFQVDYFGKFIFISNQEGKALHIGKGENRFAVFKVPTLKESNLTDDPEIEAKIKAEIPAFLHFLSKRELKHKESVSRMHFPFEAYKTAQLELYYRNSVSNLAKAVLGFVLDTFSVYQDEAVLRFSASDLLNELINSKRVKGSTTTINLKNVIESELGLTLNKRGRYYMRSIYQYELGNSNEHFKGDERNNTYYTFEKSAFGVLE
jgi:hypothetical protein